MKILISIFSPPSGTFGSLTRMIALGKNAVYLGHQVKFIAAGNVANVIKEKKFDVYYISQSTMFGFPKFVSSIIEKRSQNFQLPVKEGKANQ
jgi:UDP:flavonoid glycosyltransferase YjiC (YdhE family)